MRSTLSHPWRTRTSLFASYLDTLPRAERQKIEAAEHQFLAKRDAPFSLQRRAARDFGAVMVGVREET
jgi:hypothetical protein